MDKGSSGSVWTLTLAHRLLTTTALIASLLLACDSNDSASSDTTPAPIDSGVGNKDAGIDIDDSGVADLLTGPCAAFDELVTRQAVQGHLEQLEQAALDNDNNRAVGTPGFEASFSYVRDQLESAGLSVATPSFEYFYVLEGKILTGQSQNIVAEIAGSASDEIIMLGGHLDSVKEGPGINDNGSGSAVLIEIAKQLQACPPARTVRLAWWGAHENVATPGSGIYVAELTTADKSRLLGYIGVDMIGAPNHIYQHLDGDGSTGETPLPGTSAELEEFFRQDFENIGEPILDRSYSSPDLTSFIKAVIGVADVNPGYGGNKTAEEAELFGGTADEPYDPCYHQACDVVSNLDMDVLMTIAKSVARAVQHFGIAGRGLGSP